MELWFGGGGAWFFQFGLPNRLNRYYNRLTGIEALKLIDMYTDSPDYRALPPSAEGLPVNPIVDPVQYVYLFEERTSRRQITRYCLRVLISFSLCFWQ